MHRDIKTQNVVREDGGRLVLMDFGTGRVHEDEAGDEALSGTPLYLAPEIFSGGTATRQSDLYSVGVLLFHLVTRSYPVPGRTINEVRRGHLEGRRVWLRTSDRSCRSDPLPHSNRRSRRTPTADCQSAGELEQGLLDALTSAGRAGTRPVAPAAGETLDA